MSMIYSAACRFCGQVLDTENMPFDSAENADEYATRRCRCIDAQKYTINAEVEEKREQELRQASIKLGELLGISIAGFIRPLDVSEETQEVIFQMVEKVYDEELIDSTIRISTSTKLKISKTSKGKLEILRSDAAAFKREV